MPDVSSLQDAPAEVREAIFGSNRTARHSQFEYGQSLRTLALGLVPGIAFLAIGVVAFLQSSSREGVLGGAALVVLGIAMSAVTILAVSAQLGREILDQRLRALGWVDDLTQSARNENAALDLAAVVLGTLARAIGVEQAKHVSSLIARAGDTEAKVALEEREALRALVYEGRGLDDRTLDGLTRLSVTDVSARSE